MRIMRKTARTITLVAALALTLTACGASTPEANETPAPATSAEETNAPQEPAVELSGDITVLAAASLTESFTTLADQFMAENGDVNINLSFGSSSALALTVSEGSPADLLATADEKSMGVAIENMDGADPVIFAGNDLVIAVAPGNPENVEGLEQLSGSDLLISRCAPEVPCGRLTNAALEAGNLTMNAVTEGADVKATFAPLITGEVDAALVYRTDAMASNDVEIVEIEDPMGQQTVYPLVTLSDSDAGQAFYDYLLSDAGSEVLGKAGFTKK